jgi:hypothetical protein
MQMLDTKKAEQQRMQRGKKLVAEKKTSQSRAKNLLPCSRGRPGSWLAVPSLEVN